MILFDAPHGGYQGDVVAHDEYLSCARCGYSYPLDGFGEGETCDCGGELRVLRATPPPESTLTFLRAEPRIGQRYSG